MGIISYIKLEIKTIREKDPAIKSDLEVFLYPGFKAVLSYRLSHRLYLKEHYIMARWISQRAARKTGIEIHPGAKIGAGAVVLKEVPHRGSIYTVPPGASGGNQALCGYCKR